MPDKSTLHARQCFGGGGGLYDGSCMLRDQFFSAFTLSEFAGAGPRMETSVPAYFHAQLLELLAHDLEHGAAILGDGVGAGGFGAARGVRLGGEPAVFLHALEQRVEGARADIVAVVAQLLEHPLADHLPLSGMMQHMHLPKGEQDFTVDELQVHSNGNVVLESGGWSSDDSCKLPQIDELIASPRPLDALHRQGGFNR